MTKKSIIILNGINYYYITRWFYGGEKNVFFIKKIFVLLLIKIKY